MTSVELLRLLTADCAQTGENDDRRGHSRTAPHYSGQGLRGCAPFSAGVAGVSLHAPRSLQALESAVDAQTDRPPPSFRPPLSSSNRHGQVHDY
jgi:hypothetical protein